MLPGAKEPASKNHGQPWITVLHEQPVERTEADLLQECLDGSEDAWFELVEKYRNLIFSIPIRRGLSQDDASEVFQDVCMVLLRDLPNLREPGSLPAWLIKITWQRCAQLLIREARYVNVVFQPDTDTPRIPDQLPDELLEELERRQAVRQALPRLADRCRTLIEMLFFASPPVPYEEVARRLGVATGSIGFIRMRCLRRLRRQLEEQGMMTA